MINEVVDEKRLLLVRTLSATILVGHSDITDEELGSGKPVLLLGFRQMLSFDIPYDVGGSISIRQVNQIVPVPAHGGPADVHANVDYWIVPDERTSRRIEESIATCVGRETDLRAKEAGIIFPGFGANGG